MHPAIKILSFLSIISLGLGNLTGCGEKRIHVASVSGTPSQDISIEPTDMKLETPTAGLDRTESLDESDLTPQAPDIEIGSDQPSISDALIMPNEPVNMAHEPKAATVKDPPLQTPIVEDTSLQPSMIDPGPASIPERERSKDVVAALTDNNVVIPPLNEGQELSAQSNSSLETSTPDISEDRADLREDIQTAVVPPSSEQLDSPLSQDSSTELPNSFEEEDITPAADTFEIAKAQPSASLQDQINRIKKEELATAAAGLQDVFFPFDSWTLTKEGKDSLERTLNWFKRDFSSILIIEGHSDQRGTQAYNMVLGKRRALAVREYLSKSGIDPSHLITISYGMDKPFCRDITEVCHQLNRRGHLLVKNP